MNDRQQFFRQAGVGRPPVSVPPSCLHYWCRFVFCSSAELDPSWREQLFPAPMRHEMFDRLGDRAHLMLSDAILARLAIDASTPMEDSTLRWAIALLPRERLDRFLRHLGAVLKAQHVRLAIAADEVATHRRALGMELYRFVMQSAPLIGPPLQAADRVGDTDLAQEIRSAGRHALWLLHEEGNSVLWPRLRLKLPLEADLDGTPAPFKMAPDALQRTAWRVMREIETIWTSQFLDGPQSASLGTEK